jgi:pyridoxamine 5'-phosphate oxidase
MLKHMMSRKGASMNPLQLFSQWCAAAQQDARLTEPTAVTLATADAEGRPSARIVLLKSVDERGFVFYTNYHSRKAEELAANPFAALCCYWMPLNRQVRIEGTVERTSTAESAAYFASRPRESQVGAWASRQSQPCSEEELRRRLGEYEKKFAGGEVPCPEFWGGYRLRPERIEFWQLGNFRVHDRQLFQREKEGKWTQQQLYP